MVSTTTYSGGPEGRLDAQDSAGAARRCANARRWLTAGGVAAGPLFIASAVLQGLLRDGFAFSEQPPSALSTGDLGWVQIATFLVAGILVIGASFGLHGALKGRGSRWAPRLLGAFGVGLVGGGAFTMDPAFGFPPGTAPGKPGAVSWHGAAHGAMFALSFIALMAGCFVFARRYSSQGRTTARLICVATGPATLVLTAWPNLGQPDGRFLPLWAGVIVSLVWTSVVIADARHGLGRSHTT